MNTTNKDFYEIGYAYPTSEKAKQFKRSAEGCYYVQIEGRDTESFKTLAEATEYAQSTGYMPSFYSLDVFKGGI
jgi:hypothetical protein